MKIDVNLSVDVNSKVILKDYLKIAEKFPEGREKEILIRSPYMNALLIHLTPGSNIPPHYEDYHATFFVLEGTGIIQIGDEKIDVHSGLMVYSPKELLRGIEPISQLLILGIQEPH